MRTILVRLAAVALIGAVLSVTTDSFLTAANILNVLRQASLTFLIASGLTLTILTAGLDLSVGANVGLSACLAASVMQATGSIALGVATGLRALGSGYWLGVPVPIYLMAGFLCAGAIFTRYTTPGHEVYAIGANREAARLSGVPVTARINLVYLLSGAMAGLAAIVYLARLNSAEADIGESLTLPAIAAVLIGGTSLFGGVGSLLGTLIGALTLTLVVNGMNLLAIDASWQPLVTGVIVILAVWIDVVARQRAEAVV